MVRRKKKTQISVYLDPEIMTMLTDYAARRDQSQSMIAEAAIASFLSPDADERREAAIAKRIDQVPDATGSTPLNEFYGHSDVSGTCVVT